MQLKIEKQNKETLIIEIVNSQHTLPNLLRKALWDDPSVSLAAYEKSHPYIGSPRLVVKASNPKKAVIDAVKRTKDEVNLFGAEFEKALKK
ncbi:MAG: DNA-directed RNA polymerase subunit L [archaeon]|nr:DNA-directed RNA polymerase subunit L [archaeon]